MLMRCLDDLIRHVVIGWQVSDIDVKSRGVRRRRRNYFMGAARTRRGAPRCAAVRDKDIAFKSRNYFKGAAHTRHNVPITSLSYLFDAAAWRDQFSQMYLQLYNYNAIPYE